MEPNQPIVHRYPFTVLESHLDFFAHVNNAVYLTLFEEARWQMITERGFGAEEIQKVGIGPVILEINLKFKKELRLRQKVIIESKLGSMDRMTAMIYQEMQDEQGKVYCIGEFRFGLFDLRNRKLIPPTPEWLYAIGASSGTNIAK